MTIQIRTITVCLFSFFSLTSTTGCESKNVSFAFSSDLIKYTGHSLDLRLIIGSEYKIINTHIKNGVLLAQATKADTSFFIGVELATSKVLFNIPDPSNSYTSSTFDTVNDSIFSISSLLPSQIFITNIKTGNVQKRDVDFEKEARPGRIILNQSQIFLINDVWGVGVINQRDFSKVMFHNEGTTGLVNPQSSTLSLPFDNSLNLLSGHVIANNTMELYAITNQDSIKWRFVIKQNSIREAVSILNFPNLFVVKFDSCLVGLNKSDGKKVWHKSLNNSINEIYRWQEKILGYSLVNLKGIYPDSDDFEYKVVLKLFDCNTGKEAWRYEAKSNNIPNIGICNNILLLSDNNSFSAFSLNDGSVIENKNYSKKYKDNYAFEMLIDMQTGDYYLNSYDGKIYW